LTESRLPSGPNKAFDGANGFAKLPVALVVAFEGGLHDAVAEVLVNEAEGDALEGSGD
jgi:hypothetical protein